MTSKHTSHLALESRIKDIPVFVVEQHQYVLPLWFDTAKKPAILMHLDAHHDLDTTYPAVKNKPFRHKIESRKTWREDTYSSRGINEGNFICVAVHHGVIGMMYHYDPRTVLIGAYYGAIKPAGRNVHTEDNLRTMEFDGNIVWDRSMPYVPPLRTNLRPSKFYTEVEGLTDNSLKHPLILDIDLDVFFSKNVYPDRDIHGKKRIKAVYEQNMNIVFALLEAVPRNPCLITISRSSAHVEYVPVGIVDEVQQATLERLTTIYGK